MVSISPFKFTANQARMAVAAAVLLGSAVADASGFYAYYTRLGFADAPEATLPGRTLTGKYADVVVRLPANPHFPALRSGPLALSGASRTKQIPSSQPIPLPP